MSGLRITREFCSMPAWLGQIHFLPCWLPEPTCYGTSNRHFYRAAGPRPNDVSQELCSGLSPLNSHPPLSPDLPASWPPACLLRRCSKGQGGAENMDLRTVLDFLLFAITMQFWRRLSSLGGGSLFLATLPPPLGVLKGAAPRPLPRVGLLQTPAPLTAVAASQSMDFQTSPLLRLLDVPVEVSPVVEHFMHHRKCGPVTSDGYP